MSAKNRKFSEYQTYLASGHWYSLRQAKFAEVGRACQYCTSTKEIHVHHVNYRELRDCTTADLLVFCKDCHEILHKALKVAGLNVADAYLEKAV